MKSLWGSFVVKGKEHSVYFAGDTGYCPVFKTIGEEYGMQSLNKKGREYGVRARKMKDQFEDQALMLLFLFD